MTRRTTLHLPERPLLDPAARPFVVWIDGAHPREWGRYADADAATAAMRRLRQFGFDARLRVERGERDQGAR